MIKVNSSRGFTLLELLVVVGIISLLMAFGAASYMNAQQKSRDLQRKSDLKQIQKALELYKNDQYPQAFPMDGALTNGDLVPAYIKALPQDPRERGLDGSWEEYVYDQIDNENYTLSACLENTSDPDGNGNCATAPGILYELTQP